MWGVQALKTFSSEKAKGPRGGSWAWRAKLDVLGSYMVAIFDIKLASLNFILRVHSTAAHCLTRSELRRMLLRG